MMKKIIFIVICTIISGSTFAQFWDYTAPEKLGGSINSPAEESIPVFSKDSATLYFVRTYDESNKGGLTDQDIWFSKLDENGGYSDCERLTKVNNKYNNAVLGISKGGDVMYLLNAYDGKKDQEKGLAKSEGSGTGWKSPEKVEIPGLDIEGDFYGFHVNEDEDVIIISYNGPGSVGEEDLYVSIKNGESWSSPQHMGSSINSVGYEIGPFLSKSQDTLYFSSNGFGGEGHADIFYAVKQGDWTSWSSPVNLGPKINSPKFDAYFIHSGRDAYWSSNRDGERSDIYHVTILDPPPLSASCNKTDVSVYDGSDGIFELKFDGGAAPFNYNWSENVSAGISETILNEAGYEIGATITGLTAGEYTVTITDNVGQTAMATCYIDEPPKPLEPVTVVDYENLSFKHIFDYNKNKLSVKRGELKKFVKDIADQLKDGRPSITLRITSSASHVPTQTFGTNEKLTQVRAENMKYDLVEYFEKKFPGKVNVVVEANVVDGPEYEEDAINRSKYSPYQFVAIQTE